MNEQKKIIRWFKTILNDKSFILRLQTINLIISDIDGSLTSGHVEYRENQEGTRWFSTQDGYGTRKALQAGIHIAFVSGKDAGSGKYRADMLEIPNHLCFLGVNDKRMVIQEIHQQTGINFKNILVFGDDFLDAEIKVKYPEVLLVCPTNTPFYLQPLADLILPLNGGNHAFRLLIDTILYVQGKHFAQNFIDQILSQPSSHV